MAIFHPHHIKCNCGADLTVDLADSINVKRTPQARDWILNGELHKASCPACLKVFTVEKSFYYTDLIRNGIFKIYPRGERHTWKQASVELAAASELVPDLSDGETPRTLRAIYGMDELREKLVAEDLNLDDRALELLKVFLLAEHPFLLRIPRIRFLLQRATADALIFNAAFEHNPRQFQVEMPRLAVDQIIESPGKLTSWSKESLKADIFDSKEHWINIWRWSPQPSALDRLRSYASAVESGNDINTESAEFQGMLAGLPAADHTPAWAKNDLRTLFELAKKERLSTLEDRLFEIRFGIKLEDEWSTNNDRDDIDTLWKLLKDLPDSNVEGNSKINELLLSNGEGGGWYSPDTNDIAIGSRELANQERFEDVVRHEVGHSVHEMNTDLIDGWLSSRFGWRIFGTGASDIDGWIELMGGWGEVTDTEQAEIRAALVGALGPGGRWNPGRTPSFPRKHAWNRKDFGPRLAFEMTGESWYQNFQKWHRVGKHAFFLNYWYRTFLVVDIEALKIVARMPDSYAAMSHYEFFAEVYALYYDLDDPLRNALPGDIGEWIDENLGRPEINAPMPARNREIREWEGVTRPSDKSEVDSDSDVPSAASHEDGVFAEASCLLSAPQRFSIRWPARKKPVLRFVIEYCNEVGDGDFSEFENWEAVPNFIPKAFRKSVNSEYYVPAGLPRNKHCPSSIPASGDDLIGVAQSIYNDLVSKGVNDVSLR